MALVEQGGRHLFDGKSGADLHGIDKGRTIKKGREKEKRRILAATLLSFAAKIGAVFFS